MARECYKQVRVANCEVPCGEGHTGRHDENALYECFVCHADGSFKRDLLPEELRKDEDGNFWLRPVAGEYVCGHRDRFREKVIIDPKL